MVVNRQKWSAYLLAFAFFLHAQDEWESSELIWNFGLVSHCDVGVPSSPKSYFRNEASFDSPSYATIKSGDIVWVGGDFVSKFCQQVLPFIQEPFVLVICDGDHSFPSDCLSRVQLQELLANPYLIHLFAQNCDYQGNSGKVSQIPIGIDYHTVAYKNDLGGWGMIGSVQVQESILLNYRQAAPPTSKRLLKAFIDFQHSDSMHGSFKRYLQFGEDRTSIFHRLLESGVVDYGEWMPREELWKTKSQYAFSISPHGNGYDCHRTWEDLALGCIVIVKSSPLDPLYEGLPVVIIDDWSEVHEANFQKWISLYGEASHNSSYREKLSCRYWMEKIETAARPYIQEP